MRYQGYSIDHWPLYGSTGPLTYFVYKGENEIAKAPTLSAAKDAVDAHKGYAPKSKRRGRRANPVKTKNAPIPVGKWVKATKVKLNRNGTVSAMVTGKTTKKR